MAEDIDQLRAIEQHIQRKLEVDEQHPYHVPGLEELTESPPPAHRRKESRSQSGSGQSRSDGKRS
jgi:hypothetical protein